MQFAFVRTVSFTHIRYMISYPAVHGLSRVGTRKTSLSVSKAIDLISNAEISRKSFLYYTSDLAHTVSRDRHSQLNDYHYMSLLTLPHGRKNTSLVLPVRNVLKNQEEKRIETNNIHRPYLRAIITVIYRNYAGNDKTIRYDFLSGGFQRATELRYLDC